MPRLNGYAVTLSAELGMAEEGEPTGAGTAYQTATP
jgi:hypothetical protein